MTQYRQICNQELTFFQGVEVWLAVKLVSLVLSLLGPLVVALIWDCPVPCCPQSSTVEASLCEEVP